MIYKIQRYQVYHCERMRDIVCVFTCGTYAYSFLFRTSPVFFAKAALITYIYIYSILLILLYGRIHIYIYIYDTSTTAVLNFAVNINILVELQSCDLVINTSCFMLLCAIYVSCFVSLRFTKKAFRTRSYYKPSLIIIL